MQQSSAKRRRVETDQKPVIPKNTTHLSPDQLLGVLGSSFPVYKDVITRVFDFYQPWKADFRACMQELENTVERYDGPHQNATLCDDAECKHQCWDCLCYRADFLAHATQQGQPNWRWTSLVEYQDLDDEGVADQMYCGHVERDHNGELVFDM